MVYLCLFDSCSFDFIRPRNGVLHMSSLSPAPPSPRHGTKQWHLEPPKRSPRFLPRSLDWWNWVKSCVFHWQVHDPMKAAQGYNQRVDLWSLGVVTLPAAKAGREKSSEQSARCKHLQTVERNARQWNWNTCRTENYDPRPRQKGCGPSDHNFLVFSQSSCWVMLSTRCCLQNCVILAEL